jgi:cell division inhibitor SulA
MTQATTTIAFTRHVRAETRANVVSHSAFSSRRVSAPPHDYLKSVIDRLDELCSLETGWDGYIAPPVSFSSAYFALSMLASVWPPEAAEPQIVPGSSGDLQVEWHSDTTDIELHVRGPNNVRAWRATEGSIDDGEELRLTTDFKVVAGWLAELSEASVAARSAAA